MTTDPIKHLQEETELIDLGEFIGQLCKFAEHYIDEVAEPVVKQAKDLYEDKAVVFLVNEWYKHRSRYERDRANHMWSLAHGEDDLYGLSEYEKDRAESYGDVLYDLLMRS